MDFKEIAARHIAAKEQSKNLCESNFISPTDQSPTIHGADLYRLLIEAFKAGTLWQRNRKRSK